MEKVKLPREVGEAIEYIREALSPHQREEETLQSRTWIDSKRFDDPGIDLIYGYLEGGMENVAKYWFALKYGCDVEETPEDKVREYYEKQRKLPESMQDTSGYAVKYALDTLGIKIEGVNA